MANEASVGGFFAETVSLVGDKATETGIYVAVVGGLAAVGIVFGLSEPTAASLGFGMSIDASDSPASALYELALGITNIVASYLLLKQFLAARGRLQDGGSRFWPFLGMSILSWIGLILGLILLIVPGVILMVRWSAATGFLIGRREGVIDSLGASWQATKGHSWSIFFAGILMFLALAVTGGVVGGVFGIIGALPLGIASAFLEAAAGAVFMAFGIAIFCLVADDTEQLVETFA
jgi:hypothetical protein